jgi:tRNA threonylcarbamoyladenosine biosynthesis protein TsaB
MLILTMRTDKPEAEVGLYEDDQQLAYISWQAHRQLAETIHLTLQKLLNGQQKNMKDIQGIAVYQGPGSFTGLRIGISVANALTDSLTVPITAAEGEDWLQKALQKLLDGQNQQVIVPEYGAEVHITQQKH